MSSYRLECEALVHLALTTMRDSPHPGDVPTSEGIAALLMDAGERIAGELVTANDVRCGLLSLRAQGAVIATDVTPEARRRASRRGCSADTVYKLRETS